MKMIVCRTVGQLILGLAAKTNPENEQKRHCPSFIARSPSLSSGSSTSESVRNEVQEDSDSSDSIMDDSSELEVDDVVPSERDVKASQPKPRAQQLDLEPGRAHVMQASLFRMPELSKAPPKGKLGFLKHRRSSDTIQEGKTAPTRASFAQPRSQPPPRKYVQVSVGSGHERAYIDSGLSLGKSFRVGWGPGNKSTRIGEAKEASTS